jgi:hypothetical protein
MTVLEHLIKRLSAMGMDVPDGSAVYRSHAGRLMRQAGAWSWDLVDPSYRELCGSYLPVTELLHSRLIIVAGGYRTPEVMPYEDLPEHWFVGKPKVLFSEVER